MGFVEYQEAQIKEMYDLFVTLCTQLRDDSYKARQMDAMDLEFFIKMYDSFKQLLPFMETKNIMEPKDEHDIIPDVRDLLNLPHIEQIKAELAEKVLHATLHNSVDDNSGGGLRRRRTDMSVTREEINEGESYKDKQD